MHKYYFTVREDYVSFKEDDARTVYGINIWEEKEKNRYCIKTISDIFFCRKKAEDFVEFCNINSISPIHIEDIIEDFVFS